MAYTCCEAFARAPPQSRPIERGRPGPGLPAHVPIGKYRDHLPLDRQSKIFAREKVIPLLSENPKFLMCCDCCDAKVV